MRLTEVLELINKAVEAIEDHDMTEGMCVAMGDSWSPVKAAREDECSRSRLRIAADLRRLAGQLPEVWSR